MRVGVIDVGSNTVRLLVAARAGSALVPLREDRAFLGLGEEVESYGYISEAKLHETARYVRAQAAAAREFGLHELEVVVTAPGRQSANADDLVSALRSAAGAGVRVLAPEEEGRLAFAGALAGLDEVPETLAVADVGGGSTELVVGTPLGPVWERSLDLGCVRLTHRLELADPPGKAALADAREEARRAAAGLTPPLPKMALATGGTARALRKIAGRQLGRKQLEATARVLCKRSSEDVAERWEIDPRRTRTLLAGCLILAELQERLVVPFAVARTGLREGVALELLAELAAA